MSAHHPQSLSQIKAPLIGIASHVAKAPKRCATCHKLISFGRRREFTICVDTTWHSDETETLDTERKP